jgi:hypothetical protein
MWALLLGLAGRRRSGKPAAVRRHGLSLRLEALEDRLTPSTTADLLGAAGSAGLIIKPPPYTPFVVSGNTLNVYGTAGNDSFGFTAGASGSKVTLNGASFDVNPAQVRNVNFYGDGGTDTANLTDNVNVTNPVLNPHSASLIGPNYAVKVNDATFINAFGRPGGSASFNDSAGNDTFAASKTSASMYDSGLTYINTATGFSGYAGYAGHGGTDLAIFYDSPGNDSYSAGLNYASMTDSGHTYSNTAVNFARTHAYSSAGGTDTAYLYDNHGGSFVGNGADAHLFGYQFDNTATGFADVEAYSSAVADLYQIDGPLSYTLHLNGGWEPVNG